MLDLNPGTGSSNPSLRNHPSAEGVPQRSDILRVSDTIRGTILDTMMGVSLCPLREGVSGVNRQTLYLQLWHGYWRVRKPVPKLLLAAPVEVGEDAAPDHVAGRVAPARAFGSTDSATMRLLRRRG